MELFWMLSITLQNHRTVFTEYSTTYPKLMQILKETENDPRYCWEESFYATDVVWGVWFLVLLCKEAFNSSLCKLAFWNGDSWLVSWHHMHNQHIPCYCASVQESPCPNLWISAHSRIIKRCVNRFQNSSKQENHSCACIIAWPRKDKSYCTTASHSCERNHTFYQQTCTS